MDDNEYLLTIWCFAYNFADYIRDTFEGFLIQETNFKFRVIVFDDASTDGTSDIVQEYANKYPEIFVPYISKENTYYQYEKRLDILNSLRIDYQRGKYIAECEGDDYWIDPLKLQKQVDYLESNPECSMVVHPAYWVDELNETKRVLPQVSESRYLTKWEIIAEEGTRIQTASFVYRADDVSIDMEFGLYTYGEYHRRLYEFAKGRVYCMKEPMSVYRANHKGSWTETYYRNISFRAKNELYMQAFLEKYDKYTNFRYHEPVQMMINDNLHDAWLLDSKISLVEYDQLLKENTDIDGKNIKKYQKERRRIGEIVRGIYNFEEEKKILEQCKFIVIYGTGVASDFIRKIIEKSGLQFDGYLVSDGQDKKLMDKPVWNVSEFPYSFEDTGVVIGIGQRYEHMVRNILQKTEARFIIDCFWSHCI
ncbi:MAG: glycosyltransferase [Oribacterium sp.]|nr:glycosyltransferase [Oribacterium sp.]